MERVGVYFDKNYRAIDKDKLKEFLAKNEGSREVGLRVDDNGDDYFYELNTLYCQRCNRGLSGMNIAKKSKVGDDCPLCLDLVKRGNIAANHVGVLKTVEMVEAEFQERVAIKKRQRELSVVRGIKGTDELIRESELRQKTENDALKAELAEVKKMLAAKSTTNTK